MNIYFCNPIFHLPPLKQFVLLWGLMLIPALGFAQGNPQPFSIVSIGIGYNPPMLKYDLNEFWEAGAGGQFLIETPFYWGIAGVAVQAAPFRGRSAAFPDYLMVEALLNWGPELRLQRTLFLRAALQSGVSYWRFEENQAYAGLGNVWESEFQAGVLLAVSAAPLSDWRIDVRLRRTVIFTRKQIWFTALQVSLVRSFSTPAWLKKILE